MKFTCVCCRDYSTNSRHELLHHFVLCSKRHCLRYRDITSKELLYFSVDRNCAIVAILDGIEKDKNRLSEAITNLTRRLAILDGVSQHIERDCTTSFRQRLAALTEIHTSAMTILYQQSQK